jgi:hypothetical protein
MRRLLVLLSVAVTTAIAASPAAAVSPEEAVAGAGRTWLAGTNVQQWGTNCSILGQARPEPMVSSTASYGGAAGLPAVGEPYWLSVLVSIPGTPCGTGIALVTTDLILPPATTVDTSRRIRCFGTRRFESDFFEITDQTYTWEGSTYDYCPDGAGISQFPGALSFGGRLLANGQMFQILVPVTTSRPIGMADKARWLIDGSGVYSDEQPGITDVWTTVVQSSMGSTPTVLFTRRAARPYWDATMGRARVELFMSLYTAGQAGYLSYELINEAGVTESRSSDPGMGWDGTVPAGSLNILQLQPAGDTRGPNGGYSPWAFTIGGSRFKVKWTFTTASGAYTKETDLFRILPGPDGDGDGVADSEDACPTTAGSGANGCPPPLQADDDQDGVAGAADKCPTASGKGEPSGCPPPRTRLRAARSASRQQALAGLPVSFTCSATARVRVRLVADKANQPKLGLPATDAPVVLASANASCGKGAKSGSATLRIAPRFAKRVRASRGRATVSLELVMTGKGGAVRTVTQAVTIR